MDYKYFSHPKNEKEQIKAKLKDYLLAQPGILFVYLLGSFLNDGNYADIDLAVYFTSDVLDEQELDLTLQLSADLSCRAGLPVEVHSLNNADLEFQFQATQGELMISHDEEQRYTFLEQIWPQYFDFQYFIRENLRDLLEI